MDKTGPLDLPDTGGWQNWQTLVRSNVAINAGQQVMRLALDTNGGSGLVGNYNYFTFTATTTNPPPIFLQSAGNLAGAFADESSAIFNPAARTITISKNADTRFYRIRSIGPTRILSVQMVGANVVLTYE